MAGPPSASHQSRTTFRRSGQPARAVVVVALQSAATTRYCRASGLRSQMSSLRGGFLMLFARASKTENVATDRQRHETFLRTEHAVAMALAEAETVSGALLTILKKG